MAVEHTLRVARRTARVAHAGGTVFVVDAELDRFGRREQLFVVEQLVSGEVVGDVTLAVVHQHQVPQALEGRQQGCEQREQRTVDEDHLVVRVVDDVGELVGEQADVQRVQHAARARGAEIEFEMARRIPAEGGDTAVLRDTELVEHPSQPAGALGPGRIGGALTARAGGGDDLLVPVVLLGAIEQVGDREWDVLHQALHEGAP